MTTEMLPVLIRYASHRMSDRVYSALGRHPQRWYHVQWANTSHYLDVTEAEFAKIKTIPGVRRSRITRADLCPCWR